MKVGNMITDVLAEYAAGLGLDVARNRFKDKLDEEKLRSSLIGFIKSQGKYNKTCTYAEEIDFQGLIEYIENNLLEVVDTRIFDPSPIKRKQARNQIATKAQYYCKADTDDRKYRVATCIYNCLDIISKYYRSQFTIKDYLLAGIIVDPIVDEVRNSTEKIAAEIKTAKEDLSEDIKRAAEIAHPNQGSLYSIDKAMELVDDGKIDDIGDGVKKMLDCISTTHPYYPDFGFEYTKGKMVSRPLTEKATVMYPPRFNFIGRIRFGDQYYNNSEINPLDYSYRHQIPITLEISKALKLLGDRPDPRQDEAEEFIGNSIIVTPPKFPSAIPCALKAGDKTYFEYVLLQTQEIEDDGTYIINNKGQESACRFEIRINPKNPSKQDFTIHMSQPSNKEYLNFLCFLRAISKEKVIHVYILSKGEDLVAGYTNEINPKTGFRTFDEEIDFFERVCVIEDYFQVTLVPGKEVRQNEYNSVIRISDLIRNKEVRMNWDTVTIRGVLDHHFREELSSMGEDYCRIAYIGTGHIEIFGKNIELHYMRTFNCAKMQMAPYDGRFCGAKRPRCEAERPPFFID